MENQSTTTSFSWVNVLFATGMLLMAMYLEECLIVMSKVARSAGSSKQGNAVRASVGWNCVKAPDLFVVYVVSLRIGVRPLVS